mmetsp:Transcript_24308/g.58687  ORF Transcript_24308/g.58687 Transcript_24308/m.58687 type:complete len:269 (+) Transcript_24308:337-1143(+)
MSYARHILYGDKLLGSTLGSLPFSCWIHYVHCNNRPAILSIPHTHQHATIFPPDHMRQASELDGILHQDYRILLHQVRIRHRLQQLRIHDLLVRRTHRHDIVLRIWRNANALRLSQRAKGVGTHRPRRRLALVRHARANPAPLVPRVESASLDVALARRAAIVGHVHEGAVARAAAEALESNGAGSAEYVQVPRSAVVVHAETRERREYRLADLAHHGSEVHVRRFELPAPNGAAEYAEVGRVVVSSGIARSTLRTELGRVRTAGGLF